MNVTLSPQSQELVRQRIATGRYHDADEVLEEALVALDEREHLEDLRAAVAEGFAELERGEGFAYTTELREEMKRNARRMAQEGRKPDPDVCP